MLINLGFDIILNDNLKKDNYYFFLSKYNVNIYNVSEIEKITIREKILFLKDYELPIDNDFLLVENNEINSKLGENTYYFTNENIKKLINNEIEDLKLNYCFFKYNNLKNITIDKYNDYKQINSDFYNLFSNNVVYKNAIDYINDNNLKIYSYIISDRIPNCLEILNQIVNIYDDTIDNILIFLENPNIEIIKIIHNKKNIKLLKDFTLENLINNTYSFQNIILNKSFLPILNSRNNIEKIFHSDLIKLNKSIILLQKYKGNENIIENKIISKIDLNNLNEVEEYCDLLFSNKCYLNAFDLIENSIHKILDIQKYNEYLIKYISLGLICGRYNKVYENLQNFLKNDFSINDYKELTTILENFNNSEQCFAVVIEKLNKKLDIETINFIESIIDKFKNKLIGNELIRAILLVLQKIKESKLIDKNRLNILIEKCYKLSSHLISSSRDVLDFWTKIFYFENAVLDINKHFENSKNSPEFLYYIALTIPKIIKTNKEIISKRNIIDYSLNYLIKNWDLTVPLKEIFRYPSLNFRLSYHGFPNRELFIKSSKLIRKICPEINYKIDLNYKNSKIKILFISEFLNRFHSVFKDRHQVIKYLSELEDFDVYFTTFDNISTAPTRFEFGKAKHIIIPKNIIAAKEFIEKEKYDIIFYCEIGMSLIPYFLAHMRLAKYQFNTWGHSDTCGIDTVDYFISSKYFELEYEEAQKHYSEKLILMDSLSTCYVNPLERHKNKKWLNRMDYGYSEKTIIYSCLQSAFKYSPDFIETIKKIMEENKEAILLVLAKEKVDSELMEIISKYTFSNRIHKYNALQHDEYLNLVRISDIVLETFPFGSCNSSLEAFSLSKPVVTLPSNLINGRFTLGFYKYMGIDDLIAKSKNDYIEIVSKLTNDRKFYNRISNEIKNNSDKLFMDKKTCIEYENLFRNLKL